MVKRYVRMVLNAEYCGTKSVEYYKLHNQDYELTDADWEYYSERALQHNESYGCDEDWYRNECGLSEDDDCFDEWRVNCEENGYIEIVELDEDDDPFADGDLCGFWDEG